MLEEAATSGGDRGTVGTGATRGAWRGHLHTFGAHVRDALRPPAPVASAPWRLVVADARWGSVRLSGQLTHTPGARSLVVLMHGLGGHSDGVHVRRAAAAVAAAGLSCLRLDLRGSDRGGEDFYHAGLGSDVTAALAAPELARYERVGLLGFSLGGHVGLAHAVASPDPRLAAVAAVCSPLELAAAQRRIDRAASWLYRRYLLAGLRAIYEPVARRRALPVPLEEVRRARTLWDWDRLTVAPRWGFDGPADYYDRASVGPRLGALAVPALLLAAVHDPMVPPDSIVPAARRVRDRLELRWVEQAGHVSFPSGLDLGFDGPRGMSGQVVAWLGRSL